MILQYLKALLFFFFPALKNKYASIALILFSLIITVYGTMSYPGTSKLSYVVFSFFSFSMLFNIFSFVHSYFLLYTGTLLWLGLWWKATGFFTSNIKLVESTGYFNYTPTSFDQTVDVCSVGIFAVFCCIKVSTYLKMSSTKSAFYPENDKSLFSKMNFTYCWSIFYLTIFTFTTLNFYLGLQQAGLPPRTILPFPLNAVIYFMLSAGFGILTSFFIYYQLRFNKKSDASNLLISMPLVTLLCVSTLSRATIIFYPISILVPYFINRSNLPQFTILKKLKLTVALILLYSISFATISLLRDYYYITASNSPSDPVANMRFNGALAEGNKIVIGFKRLLISRWIGYEGVMTSVGNPNNSPALLIDLIIQKPEISRPDKYLTISKSGLDLTTSEKFSPTTLPGPIGFVYLSGSLIIVFIVIFSIVMIFTLLENLISKIFQNPFLCSFYGIVSALMFTQIGLAPINIIKFYTLFGFTLLCIFGFKKIINLKTTENIFQYHF